MFLRLNIIATESAMSSHPSSLLYFVETDMVDGLFPSSGQIRMLFCLARLKYALENKLHITIQGSMISFSHITPHVPFKCMQDLNQHQPPLWIGQCYDVYQRSFNSQHSYPNNIIWRYCYFNNKAVNFSSKVAKSHCKFKLN